MLIINRTEQKTIGRTDSHLPVESGKEDIRIDSDYDLITIVVAKKIKKHLNLPQTRTVLPVYLHDLTQYWFQLKASLTWNAIF